MCDTHLGEVSFSGNVEFNYHSLCTAFKCDDALAIGDETSVTMTTIVFVSKGATRLMGAL